MKHILVLLLPALLFISCHPSGFTPTPSPTAAVTRSIQDLQKEAQDARDAKQRPSITKAPGATPDKPLPGDLIYVGSKNSNIYHYPSCGSAKKIKPNNQIWFTSLEDAKAKGYRPCKVCKPPG